MVGSFDSETSWELDAVDTTVCSNKVVSCCKTKKMLRTRKSKFEVK